VRFGIQTHAILARTPEEADLALRSAAYLNRLGTRLREDRQHIERGAIDGTGSESGEPTWESLSEVALVGPASHMAEQLAYYEELGVTDVFVNVRFGDLDDRAVRDSMAALAQANQHPTRVAAE
jgi:alkanesulfonate monooxygenase SsuD/methylene tetrahydromethanopterin reductase-like flavin-dependent oxidoreductase (luciferase family)